VKRGAEVLGEGVLASLQKEKQVAKEAFEGETVGLNVTTAVAIELGDVLEYYTVESKARAF
jgi:translation initiation factor IF-2